MTGSQSVGNAINGRVVGSVVQAGNIQHVVLPPAPHEPPAPRQLPAGLRDFTGREDQFAVLDALLPDAEHPPGTAVVGVLDGTGGVGKTTTVVQWAHRVQERFPDGTLFVNLRGYGPSAPLAPEVVLASFLSALGVPGAQIPAGLDTQAGLYRSVLAGRRVLAVLDNANDAEQVRPLLPGTPGCMAVVTSRSSLTDLVVSAAAHRISLDLFTTLESRALLREIVGPVQADDEPAATAELVRLCGGLPLAVRVAATRAARPGYTLSDIAADISDEQTARVENLFGSEGAVEKVFGWSYTQLPPTHAQVFRVLGLHPGPEFGADAVAALTGLDPAEVYRCLEMLAELHLVEQAGRKRYRMHDLLHAYATYRSERDDTSDERQETVRRVLAWYARTAQQADWAALPALSGAVPCEVAAGGPKVVFADRAAALAWLHRERTNLIAAIHSATTAGLDALAMSLAVTCRFLTARGATWSALHLEVTELGVASARALRDRGAEVLLLDMQTDTLSRIGRLREAEAATSRMLVLADELDDPACRVSALSGLGRIRCEQGRLREAREYYQQSSAVARESGQVRSEAVALCNLSWISVQLGEFDRALDDAERGLQLRRQAGDPVGEAGALVDMALAWQGLGRHDTAASLCRQAIGGYQALGYVGVDLADTFLPLATSLECLGDLPEAAQALGEAITVLTALEDPRAEQTRQRLTDLETRIAAGART